MKKLICVVAVLAVSTAQAATIVVDDDAPLGGDGLSWNTAYRHLQDALAVAVDADDIFVAQGVYKPDLDETGTITPGDRTATFRLLDGVDVRGGYLGLSAGRGEEPDDRDIVLYESILSGDLAGDDGPDFANNGENSLHVVTGSDTNPDARLDGFTITAGNADDNPDDAEGGGMYSLGGDATVVGCTFTGNHAFARGGGMQNNGSSPTVTDCLFTGNRVVGVSFPSGGGMHNSFASSPIVTGCTFSGNIAGAGPGTSGSGAGMSNFQSSPIVTDCTFVGNTGRTGSGMQNLTSSSPIVTGCVFRENISWDFPGGAGMSLFGDSDPTLIDCSFIDNVASIEFACCNLGGGMTIRDHCDPTLINCLFVGNWGRLGGAIFVSDVSYPTIVNSTLTENEANAGGGIFNGSQSNPTLTNCILWGNDPAPSESSAIVGGFTVSYSDIEGGFPGIGNINADPRFVDPDNGDYRLLPGSPCIDAGDNTAVPEDITTDLDGNPRFLEIPETPDTGNGTLPIVDMGAYESLGGGCLAVTSQEVVCHADGTTFTVNIEGLNACTGGTTQVTFTASGGAVGQELCFTVLVNDGGFCCTTEICVTIPDCTPDCDLNGDGIVGMADFLALLAAWGSCSDCGTCPADFDGDCTVGILDLLILLGNWG